MTVANSVIATLPTRVESRGPVPASRRCHLATHINQRLEASAKALFSHLPNAKKYFGIVVFGLGIGKGVIYNLTQGEKND